MSGRERLSQMESQRTVVQNPVPPRAGPVLTTEAISTIRKQWHSMQLLPEGPQFIESVYKAQGISSTVIQKAQDQIESILKSRPTVKPLMKRRRLLSRAKKTPEKTVTPPPSIPVVESSLPVTESSSAVTESSLPVTESPLPVTESPLPVTESPLPVLESSLPILEPSSPVLDPSAPISSEIVTIYAGITDTPSVTRLSDVARPEDSCSKIPPLTITKVKTPLNCVNQILRPESVPKLSAPPSMNTTTVLPAPAIPTPSSSHLVRTLKSLPGTSHSFASPPLTLIDVSSKSIFDPVTTNNLQTFPIGKNSIAKKSTTSRSKYIVTKDKIGLLKSKCGIKECKVILYDYYKDYGSTKRFGEWDPAKSSKKTEVEKVDKKKDKKKRLKDPSPKPLPKPNQKKKRDHPKNCDQPLTKKIKKSDSLEIPVQTNTVSKIRILLRNDSDDPIGISMLDDSTKDDSNHATSNKENIMADIVSCDGSEVNPKQALWKRSVPPPNLAIPGKKIDIKSVSCNTESIQPDEICKSDKALVIRIPQTNAPVGCSMDTCLEKEKSCGNKTEPASNIHTKPQLLTGTVPAQVATTESSAQTSNDDPAISASELSPSSTPLTQVKDKPVISLEMYHARKNSKSGQGSSNSSSPTHPGTDPLSDQKTPSPKYNGHTSPVPTPDSKKSLPGPTLDSKKSLPGPTSDSKKSLPGLELKQPSASNNATTPSPNGNGYASIRHTPENKQTPKHKLLQPVTAPVSPKKTKTGTLNGASTPIPVKVGEKSVSASSHQTKTKPLALPQSALKFLSEYKETHNNNGADPRRKQFLSTVAESNNNNTTCVGFEKVTSLPIDKTATAELDLVNVALQPLILAYCRTDYLRQLRRVQWENYSCYKCNKVFPLHNDWSGHIKTCNINKSTAS